MLALMSRLIFDIFTFLFKNFDIFTFLFKQKLWARKIPYP